MNKQELQKIKKENTLDDIPGEDIVKYMPENIKNRKEEWKSIDGYEGFQVSDKGRVRYILDKPPVRKPYATKNMIMDLKNNGHGYFRVRGVNESIHRLVAQAFLPNPHHYNEVNHIDEIKKHNWKENLEWCSHKYNLNWGTTPYRRKSALREKLSTEEIRCKISKAKKGKKQSKEARHKMSISRKGKKFTEEHKRKLSKAGKGRKVTEETRRKIGDGNRGKKVSEETRRKMSISAKGKKFTEERKRKIGASHKGKKRSKEVIERISKKNRKPIVQLTLDGQIIKKWKSQTELRETLKCGGGPIDCCKGLRSSFKNYKWQYLSDYVKSHPEVL